MNADELREEMEGSKRDIQQACDTVHILYYTTHQPWMQRTTQAMFTINVKQHNQPSSSPSTIPTTSPLLVYAAAAMPHGYQRIHPAAATDGAENAVLTIVNERTVFVYDSDAACFPTLNGLLMRHCAQYKENKEQELASKLQLLAATYGEDVKESDEKVLAEK